MTEKLSFWPSRMVLSGPVPLQMLSITGSTWVCASSVSSIIEKYWASRPVPLPGAAEARVPVGVAAATRACAAAATKGSVAAALVRSVRSNDAQTKVSAARSDCTRVLANTSGRLGSRLPRAPSSSRTPNETLTEVGQRSRSESVRKALSDGRDGQAGLAPGGGGVELLGGAQAVVGAAVDDQRARDLAGDEAGEERAEERGRVGFAVDQGAGRGRLGAGGAAQDDDHRVRELGDDRLHDLPADQLRLGAVVLERAVRELDVAGVADAKARQALVVDDDAHQPGVARHLGERADVGERHRPVVEHVEVVLHRHDREVVLEAGRPERVERLQVGGDGAGLDRRRLGDLVAGRRQAEEGAVERGQGRLHRRQPVAQRRRRDRDDPALVQHQLLAVAKVAVEGGAAQRARSGGIAPVPLPPPPAPPPPRSAGAVVPPLPLLPPPQATTRALMTIVAQIFLFTLGLRRSGHEPRDCASGWRTTCKAPVKGCGARQHRRDRLVRTGAAKGRPIASEAKTTGRNASGRPGAA